MIVEQRLPIPTEDGYAVAEIGAPDSPSMARMQQRAGEGRFFDAIYELCRGGIKTIGGVMPESADIARLAYKSAELLAIRIFSLIGIDTKISHVARCPQCKTERAFYDSPDHGDERLDINDFEVEYYVPDEGGMAQPVFRLKPMSPERARKKYPQLKGESDEWYDRRIKERCTLKEISTDRWEVTVDSIDFRHPTLEDMRETDKKSRSEEEFGRKLHAALVVGAEWTDASDEIEDFSHLKRVIGTSGGGLVGFGNHIYSYQIFAEMNRYGLQAKMEVACPNHRCAKDYTQWVPLIDFFEPALRSDIESARAAE